METGACSTSCSPQAARKLLDDLSEPLRRAAQLAEVQKREAEQRAAAERARVAAKQEAERRATSSAVQGLIDGVLRQHKSNSPAPAPDQTREQQEKPAPRIQRAARRFRVDDLEALDKATLLSLVTRIQPADLVAVCASRGAGGLTERLLIWLPAGTREALHEAVREAGITPSEEAAAALERVEQTLRALTS
jgi:hypothetical protein